MGIREREGRYHGLDSLRASMMFLGLVLHSGLNYMTIRAGWPYHDVSQSAFFDALAIFIHIFRMPVFYLVAGFFGALLLARRGRKQLTENRVARIVWPFVFGWLVLFPVTKLGAVWASHLGEANGFQKALTALFSGQIYVDHMSTLHLWFLYYLTLLYVVALIGDACIRRVSSSIRTACLNFFERLFSSAWAPIALAAITVIPMWGMKTGTMETSNSFLPRLDVLAAYGSFFLVGWLLYFRRHLLEDLRKRFVLHMVMGLALSLAYGVVFVLYVMDNHIPFPMVISMCALANWWAVFGVMAFFLRFVNESSKLWRYLSDSSYWVYLVHMPLTLWMPILLRDWQAPAFIKFALVLMSSTAICLLTYQLFVRTTVLGKWLNGKQHQKEVTPTCDIAGTEVAA